MTLRPLLGGLQGLRAAGTGSCVRLLSARALSSYSRRPLRPSPSLNHSSSRPFPSSFPTSMRSSPVGLGPRSFFTEAITGLQELVGSTPLPGLVAASPLPLWATILALALTVRGCITFPMQLWQRRRVWRTRKFVVPEMKRVNQELAVLLAKESRRDGLTYKEYIKRLKAALADRQSALHKEHKTHPLITLLVPLGVSLPLFIVMSMTIRQAVTHHPELASQSFAWIAAMGEPDPKWILPLVAGLLGFSNAEHSDRKFEVRRELAEASGAERSAAAVAESAASAPPSSAMVSPSSVKAPYQPSGPATKVPSPARPPPKSATAPYLQNRKLSTTALVADEKPKARNEGPRQFGHKIVRGPKVSAQIPGAPGRRPATVTMQPKPISRPGSNPTEKDMVDEQTWLGKMVPQNRQWVHKAITYTLRGASFLVIVVGLQMPAAVVWYWTCSMGFTLVQNIYFDKQDQKERKQLDALNAANAGL